MQNLCKIGAGAKKDIIKQITATYEKDRPGSGGRV
jgi:hypothetical protein